MSPIKKVFLFVSISVLLYLIFSLLLIQSDHKFLSFNNVNLLNDIVFKPEPKQNIAVVNTIKAEQPKDSNIIIKKGIYSFEHFKRPSLITSFQTDTSIPSLTHLDAKLLALKQGKKVKIRIAYLGDSMIEGDLLTQRLRKLLQGMFGGSGVGFVPITSYVANFRTTASDEFSDNWQDENFKTASALAKQTLFFSGRTYHGNNSWVTISDHTVSENTLLEKSLVCGKAINCTIQYNDQVFNFSAPNSINRILLSNDYSPKAKITVNDANLPVYGISFESSYGVCVDNFSFRGITGVELNSINASFLKSIDENNPYDVIILGYGVNLLYKPNETNFTWYKKLITPVITKFKNNFSNSDIVIVSTADRAFRYNGEYKSAIGIDTLVKTQARLAFDNGLCFYNQFATMGGTNSIVKWAAENPPLANKDYIHPNIRGSEILATRFYNAILNDYNKYIATVNATKKTN